MKHLEKDAQALAVEIVALWREAGSPIDEIKIDIREYLEALPVKKRQPLLKALDICNEKITLLLKQYAEATVTKDCHKIFRKAIAVEAGINPVGYRFAALPFCLFKVPILLTTNVNDDSRDTVEVQRNERVPITREIIDTLLDVGVRLISIEPKKGQDYYNMAVGLSLLTGRRPYAETLHYARFEALSDYSVFFTGQAKGGIEKREVGYEIPILGCHSSKIISAQNQVTDYIQNREWYSPELTDKDISGKCKKQMQQSIDVHINPAFNAVRLAGHPLEPINPHDLRKFYAFAVWIVVNKEKSGFTQYAPEILGHNYTVKHSGRVRANTRSSESYDKFRKVESL